MTLKFFSKTLPILKADDTLPKVAKYEDSHIAYNPTLFHSKPGNRISFYHHRTKRDAAASASDEDEAALIEQLAAQNPNARSVDRDFVTVPRQARGWCDDSYGFLCMIFNTLKGNKDNNEGVRESRERERERRRPRNRNTLSSYVELSAARKAFCYGLRGA